MKVFEATNSYLFMIFFFTLKFFFFGLLGDICRSRRYATRELLQLIIYTESQ